MHGCFWHCNTATRHFAFALKLNKNSVLSSCKNMSNLAFIIGLANPIPTICFRFEDNKSQGEVHEPPTCQMLNYLTCWLGSRFVCDVYAGSLLYAISDCRHDRTRSLAFPSCIPVGGFLSNLFPREIVLVSTFDTIIAECGRNIFCLCGILSTYAITYNAHESWRYWSRSIQKS